MSGLTPSAMHLTHRIPSLRSLLINELRDLYDAEIQLLRALPRLADAAANDDLKHGLNYHLMQTRLHVDRLETAFRRLAESPRGKICQAMRGLIAEGFEAIGMKAPAAVRDAQIIGATQRVEHFEMAGYGTARAFAKVLGESEVVNLLQATLEEEGDTDKKLTQLSETVNAAAHASPVGVA